MGKGKREEGGAYAMSAAWRHFRRSRTAHAECARADALAPDRLDLEVHAAGRPAHLRKRRQRRSHRHTACRARQLPICNAPRISTLRSRHASPMPASSRSWLMTISL